MASRTRQLLSGNFNQATVRRVSTARIKRGDGLSGARTLDEEPERIESYIQDEYLDEIYNPETAMEAVNSLTTDSSKGSQGNQDFSHLLGRAGYAARKRFAQYLFDKNSSKLIEKIRESEVETRKGKRAGVKINGKTYILAVVNNDKKYYLQARDFKTGRVKRLLGNYISKLRNLI